jgi:RimJ/RimL family protein N-acetyltransferase
MSVIETARMSLREFTLGDAGFILELLNEPGFLRHIGDKGVRNLSDARSYIEQGPLDSYRRHGFGLYSCCLRTGPDTLLGMCGLVKREGLPDPDLGYAFLQRHWGRGYAVESAAASLDYAITQLKLPRILAITSLDNEPSMRVLEKIGMTFERLIQLSHSGEEVKLFCLSAAHRSVNSTLVS